MKRTLILQCGNDKTVNEGVETPLVVDNGQRDLWFDYTLKSFLSGFQKVTVSIKVVTYSTLKYYIKVARMFKAEVVIENCV